MMTPVDRDTPRPCPRCGHDLQGLATGWRSECPLAGRCTECGLDFAWGDLLSGRLHYPRWCVEGSGGLVDWGLRTIPQLFMASFRPRRMLRRIQLEHRIRPLPLVSSVVGFAAIFIVVVWGAVAATYIRQSMPPGRAMLEAAQPWDRSARMVAISLPGPGSARIAYVAGGTMMLVDRSQWNARGGTRVIGIDEPIPINAFDAGEDRLVEVITTSGGSVLVSGVPVLVPLEGPPREGAEAYDPRMLGMWGGRTDAPGPVGRGSGGGVREPDWIFVAGSIRYDVPAASIVSARVAKSASVAYASPEMIIRQHASGFVGVLAFVAVPLLLTGTLAAAVFAALPIARRRARVRWRHLGRLVIYAVLGAIGFSLTVSLACVVLGWPEDPDAIIEGDWVRPVADAIGMGADRSMVAVLVLVGVVPIAIAAVWWTWAARHYLRMQRPAAVGLSVATVANLGWITTLVLIAWASN